MNNNFNEQIYKVNQMLKNACNQSGLPIEILLLIVQNLQLELQIINNEKNTQEYILHLETLLKKEDKEEE